MTRRLLLTGLFAIGAFSAGVTPERTTLAYLTTSVHTGQNAFSAGTLHIANSLASGATLSMDNLLAGDNFDAELDVVNTGSLDLRYAMTSSIVGSPDLGSALQVTVRQKSANPCASRDGTIVYAGALGNASFGDPTPGGQPGDRVLTSGQTEPLCFTVMLPTSADATLAQASLSATFALSAEQR